MNKIVKNVLISGLMIVIAILIIGQNIIYATLSSTQKSIKLSYFNGKNGYALNTSGGGTVHPIVFDIQEENEQHTKYYCVNATVGATWNSSAVGTIVNYTNYYDLVSEKNQIQNLTTTEYSNVVKNNYGKVLWILDNMYIAGESKEDFLAKIGIVKDYTTQYRPDLYPIGADLSVKYVYDIWEGTDYGALDEKGNRYSYDSIKKNSIFTKFATDRSHDGVYANIWGNNVGKAGYAVRQEDNTLKDIIMSDELIETVQQAAIWYFTNNENTLYNQGYTTESNINEGVLQTPYLFVSTSDTTNTQSATWHVLGGAADSSYEDRMLAEQAAILFNYLIDGANAAGNDYASEAKGDITLTYISDERIVEDGDNYKVGPIKLTTTGAVTGINIKVTTGTSNTEITNAKFVDESGKDASVTSGSAFYVVVPKTSVNENITISATGKSNAIIKKLWTVENGNTEQPIVEVDKTPQTLESSISANIVKKFDLALRKTIISINGKSTEKDIINEKKAGALRNINIDVTKLRTGKYDTAIYKHRKDPVVVKYNDIVKYRIGIYNEGEIDGYASKIVDQLPKGLKSALTTGSTVKSYKGNTYTLVYDETNNKIVFELTGTPIAISAFTNGAALDYDYIEVDCKVTQEAEKDGNTKHYLTNIAYIAEAKDNSENIIAADDDRDGDGKESKPSESPNNTANNLNNKNPNEYKGATSNPSVYDDVKNEIYYEGQQDDDDFEVVVILPTEPEKPAKPPVLPYTGNTSAYAMIGLIMMFAGIGIVSYRKLNEKI